MADTQLAGELAEIGVMLLMFGVGLHFSLDDLMLVRKIAIPGALIQILVATGLGAGLASWWGWDLGAALVFGLALSVASTVVLLRALEANGTLESMNGRIAVGWLIVEDLAMVLVLVLLPALAGLLATSSSGEAQSSGNIGFTLGLTLLKVSAFVALMLVVGRRVFPALLWQITRTGSRELFTLSVVAAALTIAWGASALFGVSFALGAFSRAWCCANPNTATAPPRNPSPAGRLCRFVFVSVGMLFNPTILIEQPVRVLAVVAVIMIGKSLAAIALCGGAAVSHQRRLKRIGKPRSNRRIFIYPRKLRGKLGPATPGGAKPHSGRSAHLYYPQPTVICCSKTTVKLVGHPQHNGPCFRAPARPTRRPAHLHGRPLFSGANCLSRVWPRRAAHRR